MSRLKKRFYVTCFLRRNNIFLLLCFSFFNINQKCIGIILFIIHCKKNHNLHNFFVQKNGPRSHGRRLRDVAQDVGSGVRPRISGSSCGGTKHPVIFEKYVTFASDNITKMPPPQKTQRTKTLKSWVVLINLFRFLKHDLTF